jgi:hypothetical protein
MGALFMLTLMTLDARTGELTNSSVIGSPYTTINACLHAAIDLGPQRADGTAVRMLVCRTDNPGAVVEAAPVPPVSIGV